MNPNAKEFVPAHILKRRQEESERVNEITQQIGQVGIEDQENKTTAATTTESSANNTTTTTPTSKTTATTKTTSTTDENVETRNGVGGGDEEDDNSESKTIKTASSSSNNIDQHHNTNGERQDLDNEDDHYLLKSGEAFCEFNGEQFIIPGEDEEYEPCDQEQYLKADFDFGNAEDNEDEDVCNAYEQFLDNLPE